MVQARIVFHLSGSALRAPEELKPFYRRLIEGLRARGGAVETVVHDRTDFLTRIEEDDDFHIADHGTFRHPRLLNAGVAYVYPFWHLDPWGIRAFSSIAARSFDPGAVDPEAAGRFAALHRRRMVEARQSRYAQPEAVTEIPPGCIAVFLQSEGHRLVEETCHLTMRQMVKALLARDDPRPIVIKPHPRDQDPNTYGFLARIARDPRVTVTPANIHDILARAAVMVTINSAVGMEAHLHRVPLVLCGQSDFHHAAVTVRRRAALDAGIARAIATDWAHDAYVYWYFAGHCLNGGAPTLIEDALARVAASGYEMARLGLDTA